MVKGVQNLLENIRGGNKVLLNHVFIEYLVTKCLERHKNT